MKTLLFDSHAHYEDERFDVDRDDVIKKARSSGVGCLVNVGSDIETSVQSINLADKYDFIYASAGVHPHFARNMKDEDILVLRDPASNRKVVAIGEIGLDYYYDNSPRKPRNIGSKTACPCAGAGSSRYYPTRDATEDTLKILKKTSRRVLSIAFPGANRLQGKL